MTINMAMSHRHYIRLLEQDQSSLRIAGKNIPITPPTDDPDDAISSNFMHGMSIGPKTMPVSAITGGVRMSDPQEARRIERLKAAILGPGGHISRILVDQDGNVIEGQHRFEALCSLGATEIPVWVIANFTDMVDFDAAVAAVRAAQPMHVEHARQLVSMALENAMEEGSVAAVRTDYEEPRGFDAGWHAALDYLEKALPQP